MAEADSASESASDDSGSSNNDSATREEGVDFSGTNNQEDGVDEIISSVNSKIMIFNLEHGKLKLTSLVGFA